MDPKEALKCGNGCKIHSPAEEENSHVTLELSLASDVRSSVTITSHGHLLVGTIEGVFHALDPGRHTNAICS